MSNNHKLTIPQNNRAAKYLVIINIPKIFLLNQDSHFIS